MKLHSLLCCEKDKDVGWKQGRGGKDKKYKIRREKKGAILAQGQKPRTGGLQLLGRG